MTKTNKVPESLQRVWDWKAQIYEEVKDPDIGVMLAKTMKLAKQTASELSRSHRSDETR